MQTLKILILMTVLTILFVGSGSYFGGANGAVVMFVLAAAMSLGSYWFSDRIVLRMYRAQAPDLRGMVERLARCARVPMLEVAIASSDQPSTFAAGRSPEKGVVCSTQGILKFLPTEVNPAVSVLAIANPLSGRWGFGVTRPFSIHPPTEERIARMEALPRRGGAR